MRATYRIQSEHRDALKQLLSRFPQLKQGYEEHFAACHSSMNSAEKELHTLVGENPTFVSPAAK